MKGDRIFACVMLAVAVAFLLCSLGIVPFGELSITSPGGYPILISTLCVLFGALSFGETVKRGTREKKLDDGEVFRVFDPVVVVFLILLTLYVAAILFLHYAIATLLFLFVALLYLKHGAVRQAFGIAYIGTFTIILIFKYMFSVIMP